MENKFIIVTHIRKTGEIFNAFIGIFREKLYFDLAVVFYGDNSYLFADLRGVEIVYLHIGQPIGYINDRISVFIECDLLVVRIYLSFAAR